ncbi:RepB family plasmid replication initiator protein, partial [Streptococcus thermophilus]|nr:hypothetical protein [Streptococcus thermophilus]
MIKDTLLEPDKKFNFAPMLNGTATNKLATIGRKAKPTSIKTITDEAKYSKEKKLKVGVVKLLDILAIKFANSNHYKAKNPNRTVTFSLDEYMTLLDIKDIKDARKRLKEALNTLYSISLEWEEKSKGKVIN